MRHIISLLRPRLTSLFLSFAVIVCFAGAVASRKAIAAGQSSGVTAPVIFMTASSTPTPAPCSSKIAFTSSRDGNDEIYGMNADGSNQTRLTNNPSQDNTPSFNGDGSKIAFASARGGLYWEVYVMNADGSNQTLLTNHANAIYGLSFSRDGSKIAFTSSRDGNDEIYVMNADGSNQTRLTNNPSQDNTPSFNGDGSKIAFASARGGLYWEVYVMNADGSNQTLLTNHANAIYGLSFGG